MRKIKSFFMIFLLFSAVGCNKLSNNYVGNSYEHNTFGNSVILEAKTKHYETLEELEKDAEEIVIAKKIFQDDASIVRNGKFISHIHTLSKFVVTETFKGKLNIKDEFSILESEGFDKTSKINFHIAGYEMMKNDSEYLLFLRKSESVDSYLILAINYGKTPLKEEKDTTLKINLRSVDNENSKNELEHLQHFEEIRNLARKKYLK